MYFQRKNVEPLPEEETKIWSCENVECNIWMRNNFSFETTPTCWKCHSPMSSSMKMLPIIVNFNDNFVQPVNADKTNL